jgi:ABC-2 type transport system permease protein
MIKALIGKDLRLYFRNRFFALITVLALVAYSGLFYLMPRTVDESLEIGLYAPTMPTALRHRLTSEGVLLHSVDSVDELKAEITEGDLGVGVALPEGFEARIMRGEKERIDVYFAADFPSDLKDVYRVFLQELAFLFSGQPLQVQITEEILGRDMVGMQIPERERLLPFFAVFVLMMETIALASLISAEVEARTLNALLVSPLRIEGLFFGKGLFGVGLAFVQVTALMTITGGMRQQPLLMLTAMFLGALLVTGIGFLMASAAKDMLSVMAWGILAILILGIPAFGILFPGTVSDWAQAIPSYHLVNSIHQIKHFGAGWGEIWLNLLALLAFAFVFLALGVAVLRRKFK